KSRVRATSQQNSKKFLVVPISIWNIAVWNCRYFAACFARFSRERDECKKDRHSLVSKSLQSASCRWRSRDYERQQKLSGFLLRGRNRSLATHPHLALPATCAQKKRAFNSGERVYLRYRASKVAT